MKIRILTISCLIFFVLLVVMSVLHFGHRPKTGYVIINDLFVKFELKKELEKKYLTARNARQQILDSISIELRLLANKIEEEKFKDKNRIATYNYMKEQLHLKTSQFDEDNQNLSNQYDEEIMKQLNQYVSEFGKEYNYEFIFGNDGSGSLMYAYERNDLTNDVLEFINKRYSGL